ncbi:MAG TPA: membrane protein insertase YidC [Caulobacteraceae bacterium]|nr:membrane protein insertase YidC [Caulobacteraceae bacterium]
MPENSRNVIVFFVLALAILLGYEFLVMKPLEAKREAAAAKAAKLAPAQPAPGSPAAPGAAPPVVKLTRDQALAASPRVAIDNPMIAGSLSLKGGRFDDLHLKAYKQALDKPDPVELLRPAGVDFAQFASFGWSGANVPGLPGQDTLWTLASGASLTPSTPIVLTYDNGAGLKFTRTISVDDKYVFTIADTVANTGAAPVQIAPYASVDRVNFPPDVGRNSIVHEGGIGVLGADGPKLVAPGDIKYPKWAKDKKDIAEDSVGGWLGLTDKYWLTAVIPDQKEHIAAKFRAQPQGDNVVFDSSYVGQARTIAPGMQATETTRLFAGAKTVPLLRQYQDKLGVPRLDDAVDWGKFYFFTRPLFLGLDWVFNLLGNFGLAILIFTIVVKLALFPLANKSFESMTKMKKVQPKVEEIRARYKDDPAKLQQETMALYSKEKINPLTGCLPMFIQIPILYSLYKVLTVTIEMRHAPFAGWIQDLSARDPTSIWTLFGLLPYDPAHLAFVGPLLDGQLHLSVLALLYGFSMWLSQAMSPPAGDPTQRMIFQLMPVFLTITLSNVASGLLVYWIWSNLLTIIQQYVIMHRFEVDNPIDSFINRLRGKPKAVP